jgi:hypothetical protein
MIGSLITSQTRIKLLKKFFLNCSTRAHLRGLEAELGESSNSIRIELNRLEGAGLLDSVRNGNKKVYQANKKHPLFKDIHSIILKETGIDRVIEKVVSRMGRITQVFITGDFARGKDGPVINLVLIGKDIDEEYLSRKIEQAEKLVPRKIKYILLEPDEAEAYLMNLDTSDLLPVWEVEDTQLSQK